MERLCCIPTGRTLFCKILAFESNQVENRAISGVIASSLFFQKTIGIPSGFFSQFLRLGIGF